MIEQELERAHPPREAADRGRRRRRAQGALVAEPLERGFGLTLGNALRRVLLSSLQGAAITAVQIDGVVHEFSSLAGVREDVTDIVLNLKQLALRMDAEGPKRMTLRATGPGVVTAGQIEAPSDIEILNHDHVICTSTTAPRCAWSSPSQTGKGYVPADKNRPEDAPIGLIPSTRSISPVKQRRYRVEPTREGQVLDYDKLITGSRDRRLGHAGGRGRLRRAHPAGPAADLHQLRRAEEEARAARTSRSCRSTRCC